MRMPALSIPQKLIALIVLLMVAVVGSLATYFCSQQLRVVGDNLHRKAKTYGALAATQTRSAVAFSDKETAREVLESIADDPDVASATLFDASGEILYGHGAPSPWVAKARGAGAQVVETQTRVAAINPVESLEGPRGTLVLEISTVTLQEARARVIELAIIAGTAALGFGCIAAWLIARRLARRLRAIAEVAAAVAGGDLTREPVRDGDGDEIGVLARAFNAMLGQLQQLIGRIKEMARIEQVRLESLVTERTAQLDLRNAEMRLVFDHIDQGLLTVGLDGVIASERSAAVERWLGPVPASGDLGDYVEVFAPDSAPWFRAMWGMIADGILPLEVALAQLPSKLRSGDRHLELRYKLLTDGADHHRVLVVVTDVTAVLERHRAERDERETSSLVSRLIRDRAGFAAFFVEAGELVHIASAPTPNAGPDYHRAVHTLKGLSAMEGLSSIAELCHALETALAESEEVSAELCAREIVARWRFVTGKVTPLLEQARGKIEIRERELATLKAALAALAPHPYLATIVEPWCHERVEPRLERFADQARALAARLGKGTLVVRVECADDIAVPPERWAGFWAAFAHAVRNSVDHGFDPDAARSPDGDLVLRSAKRGGELVIEIEDHGRGIDWDRIRARAGQLGLPALTHEDLEAALFHDGLSTREHATEDSGRGIGMSALRAACVATGGALSVRSAPRAGTTLHFCWPLAGRSIEHPHRRT